MQLLKGNENPTSSQAMFMPVKDDRKWQLLTVEIPSHFPLSSSSYSIHCAHKYVYTWVSEGKKKERERWCIGKVVIAPSTQLSVFPSDVSVTVTPASAVRGNMAAWSVPANITQWEMTARDVTPFTRIDPGPGPLGTPPTSVWVSSLLLGHCHKPTACSLLQNSQVQCWIQVTSSGCQRSHKIHQCTTLHQSPVCLRIFPHVQLLHLLL